MEMIFSVMGWAYVIACIGSFMFVLIHYVRQWYDHIVYKIKMRNFRIRPCDESFILELFDYCEKNKCQKYFYKVITKSINLRSLHEARKTAEEAKNSVYMP